MVSTRDLYPLLRDAGGAPRITWYGEDGRIELSGAVLANWIAKTVNHLTDEVMVDPGDVLVVDLPAHWKQAVLVIAGLTCGLHVVAGSAAASVAIPVAGPTAGSAAGPATASAARSDHGAGTRVLATAEPTGDEDAEDVLAVALASLASSFGGELPPLVHDWVAEVRGHGDDLVSLPSPEPSAPALTTGAGSWSYADVLGSVSGDRVLVHGDPDALRDELLGPLAGGGSVVLAPGGLEQATAAREQVTRRSAAG